MSACARGNRTHACHGRLWLGACVVLGAAFTLSACGHLGHYERIEVHGAALEGNLSGDEPARAVSVYLPPSYDDDPDRRYPVLYLLHGFTNTDDRWFGLIDHYVDLPKAADSAWRSGAAEMIIVMPNAYTRFAGSMYSSSVATGDWEAYVAEDLVAYTDRHYRTIPERASRGLAGHSMGGYGALRIAMQYSQVFGALYAMSPCCLAPEMAPEPEAMATAASVTTDDQVAEAEFDIQAVLASAAAWSPNPDRPPFFFDLPVENGELQPDIVAKWAANAPLALIDQYVPELRSFAAIHLDAGDDDEPIASTVRTLAALLDRYAIAHVAEIYTGGHRDRVHERVATKLLPMMSEALEGTR